MANIIETWTSGLSGNEIELIKIVLTSLFALAAWRVAASQAKTQRMKLRMDLFDRRLKILDATLELLSGSDLFSLSSETKPLNETVVSYFQKTSASKCLLPPKTLVYRSAFEKALRDYYSKSVTLIIAQRNPEIDDGPSLTAYENSERILRDVGEAYMRALKKELDISKIA